VANTSCTGRQVLKAFEPRNQSLLGATQAVATSLTLGHPLKAATMFKLFLFLAALPVIQWIADAVKAALPLGSSAVWCWPFFVHYLLTLVLFMAYDNEPFKKAFGAAFALTWLVRTFYLFKRL
jgi:FtsH-binding integral membrane protein